MEQILLVDNQWNNQMDIAGIYLLIEFVGWECPATVNNGIFRGFNNL